MGERESCEKYTFHKELDVDFDDGICLHCSKYLTIHCPYVDEFMEREIENV
ncbi:MAG: hypothetical protein ACE5IO_00370 [Thermoplasmata archaeon]